LTYAQLRDYSNALPLLKQVAEKEPGVREIEQTLGSVQEMIGNTSEAEMSYRSALALDPQSPETLDGLARVLSKQRKYEAAIHYWNQAVSLDPQNEQFQLSLGLAFSNNGDAVSAVRTLQTLTIKHPQFEPAFFSLGSVLCRETDYSNGISAYRSALKLRSSDDVARKSLTMALLSSQQFQEATQELEIYIERLPDDAEGHYLLGEAFGHRNMAKDAERQFMRAIEIEPRFPEAEYSLGDLLLADGHPKEAIFHLQRSIALKADDAEAHFQLSRAYRIVHRPDDASREITLVQRLKQNEIRNDRREFLRNEADSFARVGKLRDAKAAYKEALAIDPQDSFLLYDIALVEDRLGEEGAEREYLARAEQSNEMLAPVHNQIAVLDTRENNFLHATTELNLALKIDPTYAEALSNLGVICARSGHQLQAQTYFRRAIEINPDYEEAHMNLGLMFASEGKFQEAEKELHAALLINPANRLARQISSQITDSTHPTKKL
jgi:tetratricopeptide (TPR) repeat protein